ncbi:hypothetical protein PGTUg99_027865 [Puccinia graminis f. sp. tritici]|uniref:Uncharacterized protein n=1 Tax=Puccinia graminis f. sp. tritici TaxID=56615 RepID=A0A5B0Q8M5_PUCGR|nr:hypothetical protein PGTUg99_027865 [Puccinia graminis f. sp. tritici]
MTKALCNIVHDSPLDQFYSGSQAPTGRHEYNMRLGITSQPPLASPSGTYATGTRESRREMLAFDWTETVRSEGTPPKRIHPLHTSSCQAESQTCRNPVWHWAVASS